MITLHDGACILPYYITSETILPATIGGKSVHWESSVAEVLDEHGKLVPPQAGMSTQFQLTASTSDDDTYQFFVRLLGVDSERLAGYTRQANNNPNMYSMFVAHSLHLALKAQGNGFEPLNSNYGVLFATADYSQSVAGETKLLHNPRLFRLADGGFGVLATPLDHKGNIDALGELLYFVTEDLVHYEEKGRIKLTKAALLDYSCERDAFTLLYRIGWKEADGATYFVTTKDFIEFAEPQAGEMFAATLTDLPIEGAEPGHTIAVTSSEARYLHHKLGRVHNVSVDVPNITLEAGGGTLDLEQIRVTAHYSDGSIAAKRIKVSLAEFAALDTSKPGSYVLNAEVIRSRFPYPMMKTRPDPAVLLYNGRYYFIATDDDGQRKIYIRCAETLEGLEDGKTEEVLLWDGNIPSGERHGQHWAPELHVINGRLYCFLAISVNNDWHGVQAHVALLKGDDPMNPDHWDIPKRVLDRHGKVLADLKERERSISLDMTYFELNGNCYVCWSQPKWFGDEQERASLYIATVNPEQPWCLTSDPKRICRNEYGWDRNGDIASGVAEGPYVIKRDDRIYMVYSGSNVGPNYTMGLLELNACDNPLDSTAWRKLNYPLMHSLSLPGQYGPGHNMLVQDKFGDWYNVYHACGVERGFRNASIRPLHFRFDGTPIFDMRDEEELLEEYETIQLTVTIK